MLTLIIWAKKVTRFIEEKVPPVFGLILLTVGPIVLGVFLFSIGFEGMMENKITGIAFFLGMIFLVVGFYDWSLFREVFMEIFKETSFYKKILFAFVFEARPSPITKETQVKVDKVLRRKALNICSAIREQRECPDYDVWLAEEVERAIDDFWKAHRLAKSFGFNVYQHYSDYLR